MITPGKVVSTFTTKSGRQAIIRYPKSEDVLDLLQFVNTISHEDTFIRFSGEQQTLEQEKKYLDSVLEKMNQGDHVKLCCYVGGIFAGSCDISRDNSLETRKRHVGVLGIALAKDFRSDGIGSKIMQVTMAEAQKQIKGLRLIKLECFATNPIAQKLYKKMGFVEVGRLPKTILHQGKFVDEIIMVRELTV